MEEVNIKELHRKIVDMVSAFCKENGLSNVEAFIVEADGMRCSVEEGKWMGGTDSTMALLDGDEELIAQSI